MSFLDRHTAAEALAGPGNDTRQWCSFGTVEREVGGTKSVHFTDDKGQPLSVGPIVSVRLHPSDLTVACRVGSQFAGAGEASWHPLAEGDEVAVLVMEGTERAGGVIVARLGNAIDTFPANVAGVDTGENQVAFWRMRSAFVLETNGAYMVRNATTSSQFVLDNEGNATLGNGSGHYLTLRSDMVSLALADDSAKFQISPDGSEVTIVAADQATTFHLAGAASQFMTQGTLNIGTGGSPGYGHAVTIEQVVSLLANFIVSAVTVGGVLAPALDLTTVFPKLQAVLPPAIQATVSPTPFGGVPAVPGGVMSLMPTVFGPTGAIGLALANPLPALANSVPGPTAGFFPGLGRAAFII